MGKIVWLASYPKSGNTWLRVFLHNYINQPDTPYSINKLTDLSASESNAAFFGKHLAGPPAGYTAQDVQRARPLVHQDLTNLHPDLVFIKTHNANAAVHGIPLCTPALTAGAIHIIRDPRDVAVSYAAYTGQTLDGIINFMAQPGAANRGTETQVFEFLGSWSGHAESWSAAKFMQLRYEDMLANPSREFGRVIRYLGGDPEPARLAKAIAFSNFKTLSQQEAEQGYKAGSPTAAAPFFRQGKAGAWQDILTETQRSRIESDHAAIMKRFNYL